MQIRSKATTVYKQPPQNERHDCELRQYQSATWDTWNHPHTENFYHRSSSSCGTLPSRKQQFWVVATSLGEYSRMSSSKSHLQAESTLANHQQPDSMAQSASDTAASVLCMRRVS